MYLIRKAATELILYSSMQFLRIVLCNTPKNAPRKRGVYCSQNTFK